MYIILYHVFHEIMELIAVGYHIARTKSMFNNYVIVLTLLQYSPTKYMCVLLIIITTARWSELHNSTNKIMFILYI